MSGELQLGGTTLATHTGSGASAKINLDSGLVFPAGHVIQTKSVTYGFTTDINITDGDVGASGVNAVGGEVSLTLFNANAHVYFSAFFSEVENNSSDTGYLFLVGGTNTQGSGNITPISSQNNSIVPPLTYLGQNPGGRNWFTTVRRATADAYPLSFGGIGQCTNTAGQTFYFRIGATSAGSGNRFYVNFDNNNGFMSLTVQEIQK